MKPIVINNIDKKNIDKNNVDKHNIDKFKKYISKPNRLPHCFVYLINMLSRIFCARAVLKLITRFIQIVVVVVVIRSSLAKCQYLHIIELVAIYLEKNEYNLTYMLFPDRKYFMQLLRNTSLFAKINNSNNSTFHSCLYNC